MFELNNIDVILGSQSPRRKQLLEMILPNFSIKTNDTDESYDASLCPSEVAVFLSEKKAGAFDLDENQLLITADTIVCLGDSIFGKPENKAHAQSMLRQLSGSTHEVITGVTTRKNDDYRSFFKTTAITFCHLTDEMINHYIEVYKPFDKAGSYGIQEWIGGVGISQIEGCYYNVMGLPLHKLTQHLLGEF